MSFYLNATTISSPLFKSFSLTCSCPALSFPCHGPAQKKRMFRDDLPVRALLLGLLMTVAALLLV